MEQPQIGPHPFFVAPARHGSASNCLQASRRRSLEPIRLVARVEKRLEVAFVKLELATAVLINNPSLVMSRGRGSRRARTLGSAGTRPPVQFSEIVTV